MSLTQNMNNIKDDPPMLIKNEVVEIHTKGG